MKQKRFLVLVVVVVLVTIFLLTSLDKSISAKSGNTQTAATSTYINGIQYIDLTAKGGYSPRTITAKANVNTVLRVKTSNTFDCSSAIVIPSLNYRNNLPPTGSTEINIPPQKPNTELRGTCVMGMYRFSIAFI